jgi:hypothetical protein
MRATGASRFVGIAVTAVFIAAMGIAATAQAPDPLIGTWKLDAAKSTFKPGPAPKSITVVIEAAGKGIKVAVDGIAGDGTPVKFGYTSMRDGKDVPVTGSPNFDAAAVTMVNPHEGSILYKRGGKTAVTAKTSVSKDGKTLAVTYDGTDAKGQALHNEYHYVKQ